MKGQDLTPYTAYLRVYEPVEALGGPVVDAWRARGSRTDAADIDAPLGVLIERARALFGLMALPPVAVPPEDGDEAFVLRVDGQVYLCPWDTRLRCWVALEELRNTVPEPVLDAFLPRAVVEGADADFAAWRAAHPNASPHILTSTWQVPLRWFVAFSPSDRTIEIAQNTGGVGRLYYRTSMADARRRVARSLQVLRRAFESGSLSDGVADLGRWLEEFHPRSRVELDYGGLVRLMPDVETEDLSAEDVHQALAALASGDGATATARYRALVDRWRMVGDFANAS